MEKSAKKVRPNDKIGENGFPRGIVANIGKLDDLADCLLQGVTWLDWQIMRNRVLREGAQAVGIE
jgi:cruciform cutting endonuclease 1